MIMEPVLQTHPKSSGSTGVAKKVLGLPTIAASTLFFFYHEIENEKMLSSPRPPRVALLLGVDRERLRAPEREG